MVCVHFGRLGSLSIAIAEGEPARVGAAQGRERTLGPRLDTRILLIVLRVTGSEAIQIVPDSNHFLLVIQVLLPLVI